MANITVTPAQAGRVQPGNDVTLAAKANVAMTGLQAGYFDATTGEVVLADASAAGTAKFDGCILNPAAANGPVTLVKEGAVYGLDVSGMDYGDLIYVSNDAGLFADAAGDNSKVCGKVVRLNGQKVAWFEAVYTS